MNAYEDLMEVRRELTNQMIVFKSMYENLNDGEPNQWEAIVSDIVKESNKYKIGIRFKFALPDLADKNKRIFLWLGVHNEGIQTWDNSLVGKDFKDAIIRDIVKNPYEGTIYFDFIDMIDQNYTNFDYTKAISFEVVSTIADKMIEHIKDSRVDGDSSEQIIIFDITDTSKNIEMIYPEFKK